MKDNPDGFLQPEPFPPAFVRKTADSCPRSFRPGAYHAPTERDQSRSKPPEPLSRCGRTMCAPTERDASFSSGRISCAHGTGPITIKTTGAALSPWAHSVRPDGTGPQAKLGPGRNGAPDEAGYPGEAAGHRILWPGTSNTTIFRKIPVSPKFLLTFRPKTGYNIRRMSLERLQTHSLRLNFSC